MTITSPTRQRRPLAARVALVSAASLSLLAGPVAFAGSASAAPYDHGKNDKKVECRVDAKNAYHKEKVDYGKYSKNSANVKFEFDVWCNKKSDVKFEHWIFQKNNHGKWVKIGDKHGTIYDVKDHKVSKHTKADVKDTGRKGGDEKVMHVVKIKYDDKDGRYSHTVTKSDTGWVTVNFYSHH